ncbi:cytoplasmic protein, partial [Nocardioides caeni]
YALVAAGLQKCLVEGGPDSVDTQKMEKLFLALA